ncbi:hypothetical protein [Flavobacterium frigoris]|uniref:Uncharacterized protein n=1 Tax=Flavobacterium frigoris TaxID=229204 RepID=A0A1H9CHE9_FLAFI|nr:hypothetical protein [Flavobacterium frigoris]SEQ00660.1 hypothetical protein SAMN05444355_101176 [Flavobacterium frigoris]
MLSCNNEELANKKTSVDLSQLKKELELNKFSNVNIAENVTINWESINDTEKGGFKISEIAAHEKTASTLKSNFLQSTLKYQLVAIESQGNLHSYFLEVYTNKGSTIYPETITKLSDFTGTLNVFRLNGENLGSMSIYKGKARNITENNNLNVLAESINAFLTKSDATSKMPQCSENYAVTTHQIIDRYEVWTVGGEIILINYVSTTTTSTTTIMPFPCDGNYNNDDTLTQRLEFYSYHNGDGGGIAAPTAEDIANAIEDNIDDTELDPCPKAIMEKLKTTTNNDIAVILKKLGANSVYTVNMKMGVMQYAQDFAETKKISKNNYLITVTQDSYSNATQLYKATALLHEMIHAQMLSVVDDYDTYPTNAPFNDFTELFKLYVEKLNIDPVVSQHEDMANRYVNAIASALEEYQKKINFPIFISDKQVFIDLAWSGLQGTDAYNKKYPGGSTDRKRLENTIIAEQIGTSYYGTNVTGKPCN